MPSAKQIEKDGLNLGEMNAKLLQKIEELTLYMIDLKKDNEALNKKNNVLEQRMEKLEK
jgi:cell division protein FtsB